MRPSKTTGLRSVADGIGILGSAVCILHCLAGPALLLAGTALPSWFAPEDSIHLAILSASIPVALVAFGLGCRQHKDRWVALLGLLGVFGLSFALAAPHDLVGEMGERFLAITSAGLLIAAHLRNFRKCRSGRSDSEEATS